VKCARTKHHRIGIQRLCDDAGYTVEVTNFAQDGYVSTQEACFLSEQLRSKKFPTSSCSTMGFKPTVFGRAKRLVAGSDCR